MAIWTNIRKGRKGQAQTFAFVAQNGGAAASGLSWSAGDAQISADGAAFANVGTLPTGVANGVYTIPLTSAEMNADQIVLKLTATGMDPQYEVIETEGSPTGVVVSDGANTASTFKTDLSETSNDAWKEALLLFVSGALANQVSLVSAYNGTTKFVTMNRAYTAAPTAGDRFVLITR